MVRRGKDDASPLAAQVGELVWGKIRNHSDLCQETAAYEA